jgi:hypothetical protein
MRRARLPVVVPSERVGAAALDASFYMGREKGDETLSGA